METFLLLAAESTHLVMKVEKLLSENGIDARIIPLPTEIKASCGLSIKTDFQKIDLISSLLETNNISMEFYKGEKIGFKKTFTLLTF
ncbi:MAG: DUF3343 domain-containing protein [Cetobacterium sp.]|uniref:DUF3343 domain-containing protein n=1 Tax=unclassified Cetobacterium TaxID=2630983 RepID=UPI00163C9D44|nr:DUF3343 domain-containing protein [Cetobacterium sp. 2A]MBC2855669.1 DUF3343 domain-containing protein [Cetobacterium sp. 2A]